MERHLAAILAADIAGYSSAVERDETATLSALRALRTSTDRLITEHGGRIANTAGDSIIVEFRSSMSAVRCAAAIQSLKSQEGSGDLALRIGVHVGEVVPNGSDVLGETVNLAARLEALAPPGSVYISGEVYASVRNLAEFRFRDLGPKIAKGIQRAIHVYGLDMGGAKAQPQILYRISTDKPSIAILPFANLSGDPEQNYLADGLVEDITTELSRKRWLLVIARTSSANFADPAVDVQRVGTELNVRYLLRGSIRKAGQQVRVSCHLIDAETSSTIWSDRYDGLLTDIFELQDRITTRVLVELQPSVYVAEGVRANRRNTADLDAWGHLARALPFIWRPSPDDLEKGIALLKQAIELDPEFGRAHAILAFTYSRAFPIVPLSTGIIYHQMAFEHARAAVRLDPNEAWCHVALAACVGRDNTETGAAIKSLEKALDLDPHLATAHIMRASELTKLNLLDEADEAMAAARRLSPKDPFLAHDEPRYRLFMSFLREDYADVLALATDLLRSRPDFLGPMRFQCAALSLLGDIQGARAVLARISELDPDFCLSVIERTSPMPRPARDRYLEALKKAGARD